MIEEHAIVTATSAGLAEVAVQRRTTCGACSAQQACGVSLLDRILGRRPQRLLLADPLGLRVGEPVVIGVAESALLRAALAAYLLPLAGLLPGALLAAGLFPGGDLPAVLGGLTGLAAGFLLQNRYSRHLARDPRYRAVLLRRAGPTPIPVAWPRPRPADGPATGG